MTTMYKPMYVCTIAVSTYVLAFKAESVNSNNIAYITNEPFC